MNVVKNILVVPHVLRVQRRGMAGRYGREEEKVYYDAQDLKLDEHEKGATRKPFTLGLTTRAAINRNRQRLGLPQVVNWKKFTSEAVKVRDELCGLDDPRAQQQLEREKKSKAGSSWTKQDERPFGSFKKKPFAKYSQTSSEIRPKPTTHPMEALMHLREHEDAIRISRMINESNRQSVADAIHALGRPKPNPASIKYIPRNPVVSIMGHVDHGKTTLLDLLRKSDITAHEAGGITQSIGAFTVKVPGHETPITFIDTPGHAAFDNMRKAGINATDIVILVISIREGVQDQTIEVINHIKEAGLTPVVAVNKVDLSQDVEHDLIRIGNQLSAHGIILESMGGDVLSTPISAKRGVNIDALLENVLLQSEMLELTTPVPCRAEGLVIESKALGADLTPGSRPEYSAGTTVANIIVKRGVFKKGMSIISGEHFVKLEDIHDEAGNSIPEAGPGQPASLIGFGINVPAPNSLVIEAGRRVSQKEWKNFWTDFMRAKVNKEKWFDAVQKEERLLFWNPRPDIADEALYKRQRRDDTQQLRLILKANTQGMADAMETAVDQIPKLKSVVLRVIHKGVGDISDQDGALYNHRPEETMVVGTAVKNASLSEFKHEPVLVDVIYDMIESIKQRMTEFYPPRVIDVEEARAEVKQVFKFSGEKEGNVGGSFVSQGRIHLQGVVKVLRTPALGETPVEVFRADGPGAIKSIRHVKEEVQEITSGMECGIILSGFTFEPGDVIIQFKTKEEPRTVEEVFAEDSE
eukprot:TRINITY_DN9046_c0_g1_i1.p1 TRINITY_DN9046_c0_g1~~TRINITY_DN9046_c0_g1_i1.p1  ORF type:complete len:753 (+),score=168.32 TRINITY_DN9046_c0_g1_i1:124-2382(+)